MNDSLCKGAAPAIVVLLSNMLFAAAAFAAQTTYPIEGFIFPAENSCSTQILTAFGQDCSSNNSFATQGEQWIGPVFESAFYFPGQSPFTNNDGPGEPVEEINK